MLLLLLVLAVCSARNYGAPIKNSRMNNVRTTDLSRTALENMMKSKFTSSSRVRTPPSGTSSMRDADPWDHNAWGGECVMQATLLLPNMTTPAAVPYVLKTDPVSKRWYSNAGPLGVQWINATSAFTVQETPNGPVCWQIPGWTYDKQVAGYRGMFESGIDGPVVRFSGGVHDITGCGCEGAHSFQFFRVGGDYRLLNWAVEQPYPYLPFGAQGVKINVNCHGFSGEGPTDADMTLPAICHAPYLQSSYCDVFTPPSCHYIPHP